MNYYSETKGLAQITQLDGVGAEKFVQHAWRFADNLVREQFHDGRCWCESAECSEHGANSAIYTPPKPESIFPDAKIEKEILHKTRMASYT